MNLYLPLPNDRSSTPLSKEAYEEKMEETLICLPSSKSETIHSDSIGNSSKTISTSTRYHTLDELVELVGGDMLIGIHKNRKVRRIGNMVSVKTKANSNSNSLTFYQY